MSPEDVITVYQVVLVFLAVLIVMVNSLLLVAIIKSKHLHLPTNIFVAGTAIADISVGLIAAPLKVFASTKPKLSFDICLFINILPLMLLDISILVVLGLAIDRLFAIRYPFGYRRHFTCGLAMLAVALLSIFGFSLEFVPVWFKGMNGQGDYTGTCGFEDVISPWYLFYFRFVGLFMIPVTVMGVVNLYIFRVVKGHKLTMKRLTIALHDSQSTISTASKNIRILKRLNRLKKENATVFILPIMVAVFILSMLPLNVMDAIWYFSYGSTPNQDAHYLWVGKLLYYMSSLINPIIYGFCHSKIRKSVRRLLGDVSEETTITSNSASRNKSALY